jgi:type I restriction enzyme M protein
MNVNGRAGIVVPHGVLFKGDTPSKIREQILKNDLVEAVIAMPPKLFYGVGIPVAILIFNKNKPEDKKNKVLIINAEKDFLEGKNQNSLRPQDINKIVKAYDNYSYIEKYARVVGIKEIAEKDYNLNLNQYIDSSEQEEAIDVKAVREELATFEKEREVINKKVESFISELNY